MRESNKKNQAAIEALKKQLITAGIDTALWGKGQAKTLAHLIKEIEDSETILTTNQAGELLRTVVVVKTDIFYESPDGKKYKLKEERQVFKDGRERRRDLGQAVSEKMQPAENPANAAIRGIHEELGIGGDITVTTAGTDEETIDSPSYPGLKSQYISHRFRANLSQEQFNPNGYTENQADKSTYFVWEEI